MRGADAYNEALFSMEKLEEFVPQPHWLRPIRKWFDESLATMDAKFSTMYEAYVKGRRPSIAPEKLMRAMLLQVLYSVRSDRQLVEQISHNLLFRWFVGLSIEDMVWRCGTTRCSARTAIARASLMQSPICSTRRRKWPTREGCCRASTSAWTVR